MAAEVAARGHEVMFLVEEGDAERLQPAQLPLLTYKSQARSAGAVPGEFRVKAGLSLSDVFQRINPLMDSACRGLLENPTIMRAAKDFKPDLLLAEMFYPCSNLLAAELNVSWINVWPIAPVEPHFTSLSWAQSNRRLFVPNPLSYMPQFNTKLATQRMTFWQRLQNFHAFWSYHLSDYFIHHDIVTKLYNDYGHDNAAPAERRRMVLTMAPVDWAAEWLRPVTPDFKMVGPVLAEPGKPLPAELEAFMESAGGQGVLLVSLGTIAELDLRQIKAMAAAFASQPCKVLWRLTMKEYHWLEDDPELRTFVGNNTKVVTWMPQNDLLAHPSMRAFVSHVGINSQYEAIYHGVPLLCLPFFGDQHSNANRVVAKGFGVQLSPLQIATPTFPAALHEVLHNPKYAAAARALSTRIRARKRTPTQEAADWIEHVMETGGEAYLRTPEAEMNIFARHSLDVYGFVLACLLASTYAGWLLLAHVAAAAGRAALLNGNKAKFA